MRKLDRSANLENWPSLYYPELYLLHGGYNAFFRQFPDFCEPREYVSMFDRRFVNDCQKFHSSSHQSNPSTRNRSHVPRLSHQLIKEISPRQKQLNDEYSSTVQLMDATAVTDTHPSDDNPQTKKFSKRNNLSPFSTTNKPGGVGGSLSKTHYNIFKEEYYDPTAATTTTMMAPTNRSRLNSSGKILFGKELDPNRDMVTTGPSVFGKELDPNRDMIVGPSAGGDQGSSSRCSRKLFHHERKRSNSEPGGSNWNPPLQSPLLTKRKILCGSQSSSFIRNNDT